VKGRKSARREQHGFGLAPKEQLIDEAQRLGYHRSKEETITAALAEYVRLRKRKSILCVCGDLEEEKGE
jgi:hypothetical protein